MTSIAQKFSTACRYATSPSRYPFVWRRTVGRVLGAPSCLEQSAVHSRKWCARHAVSNAEALNIAANSTSPGPLESRFPAEFEAARAAVSSCPQKMGGGANTTLLHDLVAATGATNIIETGVAYGWSSLAILLALSKRPGARLVSTNLHYREYSSDSYVGCAVPGHLREPWTIIRKSDDEALPEALAMFSGEIDLCHYDSNKSYGGRLRVYPILWQALKPGGILISDDIQDNLAFVHFCRMASIEPIVTNAGDNCDSSKFIGIARKSHDRPLRKVQF